MTELDGILSTETYHVLRTEKIDYDWKLPAEFTRPAADRCAEADQPPDASRPTRPAPHWRTA